jgi:hypothetical protein
LPRILVKSCPAPGNIHARPTAGAPAQIKDRHREVQKIGFKRNTKSGQSHAATLVHHNAKRLGARLAWPKARLDCFALLEGAVLVQRTVSLAIPSACPPRGTVLSACRRFYTISHSNV